MGVFDHLPVLNQQPRRAVPKGESRLQAKVKAEKADAADEERWKQAVRKRDGMQCRWCKRKVVVTIELVQERAECHHIHGRAIKSIRWDVRASLLLCLSCHERVTGKVNERFLIESAHTFLVDGVRYINADKPVRFVRVC